MNGPGECKTRQPGGLARVCLFDLDRNQCVDAQYNPKELQVDKSTTWGSTASRGNVADLTFGSTSARTVTVERLFDTFEYSDDVHDELEVIDPDSSSEATLRPPRVQAVWGEKLPRFVGVVDSINTKHTMFLPHGTPVRATCTVKLTEAKRDSFRRGR